MQVSNLRPREVVDKLGDGHDAGNQKKCKLVVGREDVETEEGKEKFDAVPERGVGSG